MNIILDTNIFVQNYLLSSHHFNLLFDYLNKTNSKILVPRIVIDELLEKYRKSTLAQLEILAKAQNRLENIIVDYSIDNNEVDVDLEVSNYSGYFLGKLGIDEKGIIEHKTSYLDELVTRAIKRRKPFSEKGEEFRDALLWLAVLDITIEFGGVVAFISNDGRAFGKAGTLHDELYEEMVQRNIQVNYFTSIKAFIEQQATQVEFVNEKWFSEVIDFEQYDKIIEEQLSERLENNRLYSRSWDDWKDLEYTGYINRTADVDSTNIYTFYVYEKTDGNLYIEIQYIIEYEVEFHIEERSRHILGFSSSIDEDIDYTDKKNEYTIKYAEAEIIFGIDVSNGTVTNIELTSVDI